MAKPVKTYRMPPELTAAARNLAAKSQGTMTEAAVVREALRVGLPLVAKRLGVIVRRGKKL